jgi:hypothetical protein
MAFVFTTVAPALSAEAAESVGDVSACAIEPPADFQSYFKGRKDVAWRVLTVGAAAASIGAVQTLTSDDCGRIQSVSLVTSVMGGYTGSTGSPGTSGSGAAAVLFLPPIAETIGAEIDIVIASADVVGHSLIIACPDGASITANIGVSAGSASVTSTGSAQAGGATGLQVSSTGASNVCIRGAGAQIHCVNVASGWCMVGNASVAVINQAATRATS